MQEPQSIKSREKIIFETNLPTRVRNSHSKTPSHLYQVNVNKINLQPPDGNAKAPYYIVTVG